jgi:hypothetical protein
MKAWRSNILPYTIACNNSKITINILEEKFCIYGDKYELAESIIKSFLDSGLTFQNHYFFALERFNNKTRFILYNNPNQDFFEFSLILKKYLDNYLFS